MKSSRSPRLVALQAILFEKPSPNYALVAMLVLLTGATVVFGGNNVPALITHVVMLLTLLGVSRLFNDGLLRWFWYSTVGLIAMVLALDIVLVVVTG